MGGGGTLLARDDQKTERKCLPNSCGARKYSEYLRAASADDWPHMLSCYERTEGEKRRRRDEEGGRAELWRGLRRRVRK